MGAYDQTHFVMNKQVLAPAAEISKGTVPSSFYLVVLLRTVLMYLIIALSFIYLAFCFVLI